MAELATIARPYAEALFKACADTGADLSSTVAWVEELAAIAADPQLRQLADSPKVTNEQVLEVITGVRLCRMLHATSCASSLRTAVWMRCPKWHCSSVVL